MAKAIAKLWPFFDVFAPLLWPVILLLTTARLALRFAGAFGGAALPDRLRSFGIWARENETFTNNLLLVAAVIGVVFSLPARVRRRGGQSPTAFLFIVGGILALGETAVRVVLAHPAVVVFETATIAALILITANAVFFSKSFGAARFAIIAALLALALPSFWRAALELAGRAGESGFAIFLRKAADLTIPATIAALAALGDFGPAGRRRAALAAVLPVFFLVAAFMHPLTVREALADVTQLWFTTMPWGLTAVISAAALWSVLKLVVDGLSGRPIAGIALAALIWLGAGTLPVRAEGVLLSYLALSLVLDQSRGDAAKLTDLPDTFRG